MYKNGDYLRNLYAKLDCKMEKKPIKVIFSDEMREKTIYTPIYQRKYQWNQSKATKLLETIFLNGEVPPIIVVEANGTYEIIDGRQRYESLLLFYNDQFTLKEAALSQLKMLNGRTFSNLPVNYRKLFEESKLRIMIYSLKNGILMDPDDLEHVKRDLFRRYNNGMTALDKSEVARAKYLKDEFTILLKKYFLECPDFYKKCHELYLPIRKKEKQGKEEEREKINLLLMKARKLLAISYIPIIESKTVTFGNAVIEKYYESFVMKEDLKAIREQFVQITKTLYQIKEKLKMDQHPLQDNVLFYECAYWMLSILYQLYSKDFYHFNVESFCRYIENQKISIEYFTPYKSMSAEHIVNRYNFLKKYISEKLHFNIDDYLQNILNNSKKVGYKKEERLKKEEVWCGFENKKRPSPNIEKFSLNEIIDYIHDNRFVIRPVYQRKEVKSIAKASKILESIFLGVKIPPIYITKKCGADQLDYYSVIDRTTKVNFYFKIYGRRSY